MDALSVRYDAEKIADYNRGDEQASVRRPEEVRRGAPQIRFRQSRRLHFAAGGDAVEVVLARQLAGGNELNASPKRWRKRPHFCIDAINRDLQTKVNGELVLVCSLRRGGRQLATMHPHHCAILPLRIRQQIHD
jgi:hypothetical protein